MGERGPTPDISPEQKIGPYLDLLRSGPANDSHVRTIQTLIIELGNSYDAYGITETDFLKLAQEACMRSAENFVRLVSMRQVSLIGLRPRMEQCLQTAIEVGVPEDQLTSLKNAISQLRQ